MEDNVAIKVTGLGKKYTIGKEKDSSLRSSLAGVFKSAASKGNDFWALKDVNFEIKKGEVVGIIGKNGAGKSTLLKVLSQITKPTEGRIEINGRVASLLEVGTGFHPELTGRENIFLNGTILGMTRKEVKEKFDEIIEFSGVQKFVDTPVKHYSSGMYVRLAFAVAAHLEPEILIIDEVLAVGDAEFQKKCLWKMKDVAKEGRTVIFVSHDLGAVRSLCTNGILLRNGEIIKLGSMKSVINKYVETINNSNSNLVAKYNKKQYSDWDKKVNLINVEVINELNQKITHFSVDDKIAIRVQFEIIDPTGIDPIPNIHVSHSLGGKLSVIINTCKKYTFSKKGICQSLLWFPKNFFNNGHFTIGVAISSLNPTQVHVSDYDAITFEVLDNLSSKSRNGFKGAIDGYFRPILKWDNDYI